MRVGEIATLNGTRYICAKDGLEVGIGESIQMMVNLGELIPYETLTGPGPIGGLTPMKQYQCNGREWVCIDDLVTPRPPLEQRLHDTLYSLEQLRDKMRAETPVFQFLLNRMKQP